MAGFSDYFESAVLAAIFQNATIANLGDATGVRGSTAAGNVWVSLFTASPTDSTAGTETTYTNYARVAVVRSTGAWTISGTTQIANAAAVTFPQCGATGAVIVAFGIHDAATAGNLLGYGTLSYTAAASNTPSFAINALVVTLD